MAMLTYITAFISILYAALIIYYRFAWCSIPDFIVSSRRQGFQPLTGLSTNQPINQSTNLTIIIPARNEEQNIEDCINSILDQSYPKELFEIIVVDDHSEDNTAAIVKKYAAQNVKLISLSDHVSDRLNSYKKKAIEVAVAQASGTLIITTDADCFAPKDWLQTIAAFYEEKKPAFIAAPVAIDCSMRFIEIFQALDFMTLQGITGAVVSKKQMTMCNGANMAYERAAFYEVNGFAGIDNIASGDDMLLMHKIYKRYPERVMFLKSRSAIMHTAPVHTTGQFFNQRIRWASKADKYDDKRILPVLALVYLFNCLLLALPVVAIFNNKGLLTNNCQLTTIEVWLLLILFKTIAELIFLYPIARFFNKQALLWLFPLMQPFHILYTIIAGWLGKFGKYDWKGRSVK
jgi:cellulose synthase/poly-beta-1,6-N-acetylglucosamine synthase-like glycosyltransferase